MDPKGTKSPQPTATHHEVPPDTDSTLSTPTPSSEPKHARPGEAIMKSDDPSTAALRAWAADKQLQVPGSDGSFVLGRISGGAGAVSGGPMFLPRKEFIVEPPFHSVDHGPVSVVKREEEEGEGKGQRKRRSFSDFFGRRGEGKGGSEKEG